jgi:hypothetical protein
MSVCMLGTMFDTKTSYMLFESSNFQLLLVADFEFLILLRNIFLSTPLPFILYRNLYHSLTGSECIRIVTLNAIL